MKVRFFKPEEADPERDQGIQVPYGAAKRHLARWRWYLILLVVASPILYFLFKIGYSSALVTAPAFVRQQQITIRAQSHGYVESVAVEPPARVEADEPLVQLENPDLKTRQKELRAELADLEKLKSQMAADGITSESLKQELQSQLTTARQQSQYYEKRVRDLEALVQQGAATESELSAAQDDYQRALSRISDLKQALASEDKSSTDRTILPRIRTIQAELSGIENQLNNLTIRAPESGNITDISVTPGDQLSTGSEVATIIPTGAAAHIAAYLAPEDADYARIGQQAKVKTPNGTTLLAEVTEVPDLAARVPRGEMTLFNDEQLAVLVRMKIIENDGPQPMLAHGLPVRVRFLHSWEQNTDFEFDLQEPIAKLGEISQEKWAWLQQKFQN